MALAGVFNGLKAFSPMKYECLACYYGICGHRNTLHSDKLGKHTASHQTENPVHTGKIMNYHWILVLCAIGSVSTANAASVAESFGLTGFGVEHQEPSAGPAESPASAPMP